MTPSTLQIIGASAPQGGDRPRSLEAAPVPGGDRPVGFERMLRPGNETGRAEKGVTGAPQDRENGSGPIAEEKRGSRFLIPNATSGDAAETRSEIGRKLARIEAEARERLENVDAGTAAGQAKIADVVREMAARIREMLADVDAETGSDAVGVMRETFLAAGGVGPDGDEMRLPVAEVPAEIVRMTAAALDVALPLDRQVAARAARDGGAGTAVSTLHRLVGRAFEAASAAQGPSRTAQSPDTARISAQPAPPAAEQTPAVTAPRDVRREFMDIRAIDARPSTDGAQGTPASAGARGGGADGGVRAAQEGSFVDALRNADGGRGAPVDRGQAAPSAKTSLSAAVAQQIRDARANTQVTENGRTRVALAPRGLGNLELDLNTDPTGRVSIVVRADNPMVLEALRADRDMLGSLLSDGRSGQQFDLDFDDLGGRDGDQDEAGGADDIAGSDGTRVATDARAQERGSPDRFDGGGLDILA